VAAYGRFLDSDRRQVALIGAGVRPRLVLLEPSGPSAVRTTGAARLGFVPREVMTPTATFNVNVGQGGFNFVPATVSIAPGDTVQWNWSSGGHNVISGSACTANNVFCSPSNMNCGAAPLSNMGAVYSRVFPSAGTFPYFCNPHCGFGMTGTVQVQAPATPGSTPNGTTVPGTPFTLGKGGGANITASWGASCSTGANNYALYEGDLPIVGGVYTHAGKACNIGNVTTTSFTTTKENAYYLLVPETATTEGSYGRSSTAEIPPGTGLCRPTQNLAACP
jgi:plastocyanin